MSLFANMKALEEKAEVGFEHIEAVLQRVLEKLHLVVDHDAENAKLYIKALAVYGIDDLTHQPPQPASAEASAAMPAPTNAPTPIAAK